MLSFMREQENGNSSDRASTGADSQAPLSSDPAGAQEYLTVAANSRSVRRSTIFVVVLVCIGLVCLFLMIRKTQPQAASAKQTKDDETKIEAAISRLTGVRSEMADRMDEIVTKFYEFSDVSQIEVDELVKNPFQVEGFMKEIKDEVVLDEDPRAQAEMIRRQRLQQQASTLRLLSVMRSEVGHCCMINDQILREGEVIEGFTVTKIGSNSVNLTWAANDGFGPTVSETKDFTVILKLTE